MRINYMDPALLRRAGHHLQWFERIAGELQSQGHELRAYVNRSADAQTLEAVSRHARAEPVFLSRPYAPAHKVDPVCGELALFMEDMHHLPGALSKAAPADLWVWPTLFAPQLQAIVAAGVKVPVAACIHSPPDRPPQMGRSAWRYGAVNAARAGIELRASVTVPELAPLYEPLFGRSLPVLPIPIDAGPEVPAASRLETIGFFGHQGGRKGAEMLPLLAARLLQQGYKVVIQDSSGRMVAQHGHANLRVLGYVPSLADEISRCDLVVAPYDPDHYRHQASAIVWDAISRGIPLVAPHGTSPGTLVEQLGAGTTFVAHHVDGILAAIAEAGAGFARISQGACRAREWWRRHQGVARHVCALLRAEPGSP